MVLDPKNEIQNNTDFLEVERQEGSTLYIKGHTVPINGVPTPEELLTANLIKHHLKHFHWKTLNKPLYVGEITPFATELAWLIALTSGKLVPDTFSRNVAWAIDKDLAYKWRLQDLFSETAKNALIKRPFRELKRLTKINKRRDIYTKSNKLLTLITLAMLFPHIRKRFRRALNTIHFPTLQLDESARYWLNQRKDYYGQE